MSAAHGKALRIRREGLIIEDVGCLPRALESGDSVGNAFRIIVRDLGPRELQRIRKSLDFVRQFGLPNYFDEQRFGNLRHGQGWIFLELVRGRVEEGLRRLLTRVSPHDDRRQREFKSALYRHWGDWQACRQIAGRFGAHHSLFEHLRRSRGDFIGAFRHVASRVRLIHLYAYQSHLWNRAVARYLEEVCDRSRRFGSSIREGKLIFPKFEVPCEPEWEGRFPLVGERLGGVTHEAQRRLYLRLLQEEGLSERGLSCKVPGFTLKAEERELVVVPRELRVRPAEPDPLHPGRSQIRLQFELPRGAYATLVLRRLIGPIRGEKTGARRAHEAPGGPWSSGRAGGGRAGGRAARAWPRPRGGRR